MWMDCECVSERAGRRKSLNLNDALKPIWRCVASYSCWPWTVHPFFVERMLTLINLFTPLHFKCVLQASQVLNY